MTLPFNNYLKLKDHQWILMWLYNLAPSHLDNGCSVIYNSQLLDHRVNFTPITSKI